MTFCDGLTTFASRCQSYGPDFPHSDLEVTKEAAVGLLPLMCCSAKRDRPNQWVIAASAARCHLEGGEIDRQDLEDNLAIRGDEARSKNGGKPPPESFSKIHACGTMSSLTKTGAGHKSLLCTDGAPCYPRLAKECGALLHFVNHSAGEFARPEWYLRKHVSVHTATIDSIWAQVKRCIPNSLGSTCADIPMYIRMWQWRHWHSSQHASEQNCDILGG